MDLVAANIHLFIPPHMYTIPLYSLHLFTPSTINTSTSKTKVKNMIKYEIIFLGNIFFLIFVLIIFV